MLMARRENSFVENEIKSKTEARDFWHIYLEVNEKIFFMIFANLFFTAMAWGSLQGNYSMILQKVLNSFYIFYCTENGLHKFFILFSNAHVPSSWEMKK